MDGPSDEELRTRQSLLQVEAAEVLAELDQFGVFDGLEAPLPTGSYVSGLMCWRELDIMVLGGSDFSPRDVLSLLDRVVAMPGVFSFEYHDERGERRPTAALREERYHLPIMLERNKETWRLDLTIWLHDLHANVTAWHEAVRDTIDDEQRDAILRVKDIWCQLPDYPDQVSGSEIYTAVLDHGVRSPEQFAGWLADRAARSS